VKLSILAQSIFNILNKSILENSRLSLLDVFHIKALITKSNSESKRSWSSRTPNLLFVSVTDISLFCCCYLCWWFTWHSIDIFDCTYVCTRKFETMNYIIKEFNSWSNLEILLLNIMFEIILISVLMMSTSNRIYI